MVPGYVRYTEIYDGIVSVLSKVRNARPVVVFKLLMPWYGKDLDDLPRQARDKDEEALKWEQHRGGACKRRTIQS